VELLLKDFLVKETFFLFELDGVDVILKVAWLATLGEVKVNRRTLMMSVYNQGREVKIKEIPH